jgi:hypothetical protein
MRQPTLFPGIAHDDPDPLVLLIGNVDHEGITSALKSSGTQYKKKLLESRPENWTEILRYFYGYTIKAVIIKLNARVYDLLALPAYKGIADDLFEMIATKRHAVFVFEDLLSRRAEQQDQRVQDEAEREGFDADDEEDSAYYGGRFAIEQPATQVLEIVNRMLRRHDLNLVPYRTNAEVTVIASQLLKDALEGLLFRVYVPTGRLWANEVDRLLQLFTDYLHRTGRKSVRLDQVRTDHGISYEFRGDEARPAESLSADFQDFSRLLDLCVSHPAEAEALLKSKTVDPKEISGILTRYSKEAKRLQVDLRHERERKLLDIRQRLESELTDCFLGEADWDLINKFVATAIPAAYSIASLSADDKANSQLLPTLSTSELTININPQIVTAVNSVVARELQGDVSYSVGSKQLLDLIESHSPKNSSQLVSAAQELEDTGITNSARLTSAQKLKSFVYSVGEKIGPVATKILTDYIEMKLGMK